MDKPGARRWIYEVRAEASGHVGSFGVRHSAAEAEELRQEWVARHKAAGARYERHWVEQIETTGLYQVPSRPTPRERYTTRVDTTQQPGTWPTVHVDVLDGDDVVAGYDRNYEMLSTFEPFRQDGRTYALISPHYMATSVLDLQRGEIIASEELHPGGFCPVGFYVPDWWDLHDGTTKSPGSLHWRPVDDEWPVGDFGFVWGCVWGDDSSWKVHYLDLSAVRDGIIRRDDRFGYLKLATNPKLEPRDLIKCSSWEGRRRVVFAIETQHDLTTGEPIPDDEF